MSGELIGWLLLACSVLALSCIVHAGVVAGVRESAQAVSLAAAVAPELEAAPGDEVVWSPVAVAQTRAADRQWVRVTSEPRSVRHGGRHG